MIVLQTNQLTKSFGVNEVLKGVTLTVQDHHRVGLVGSNGSGKSTLLKILAGQDAYDGGTLSTTRGLRTVQLARDVESQGAMGVVLNAPINNLNLRAVSGVIDIPTVITVTKFDTDLEARIEAGASILNIAAAAQTPELVREARKALPDVPIIATGGKTGESILRTIEAGANAITYTPPSTYELFQEMMKGYRE